MIDKLLEALNATGVPFVRDAWVNMPAGDYGVIDNVSESYLWADDRPIFRRTVCSVWLYTRDAGERQLRAVKDALNGCSAVDRYSLNSRTYLDAEDLVRVHLSVTLRGGADG